MNTLSKRNKSEHPLLVGLTGGIGSGKSTVAKIFQAKGIKVFNSDLEAKEILNKNESVRQEVVNLFGDVYVNGKADTGKIAAMVFGKSELLQQLNQIIHPRVNDRFIDWVKEHSNDQLLLKEAAILIETGAHEKLDGIILVVAPEELRIKRILERDSTDNESVKKRMKAQLSDEEKLKHSNYVIHNNERDLLILQVENILKEIIG